ncbi:hypothetical protein [Massilia sp. TN1-12]|uniref:hypothetical protein n=1 Tax=Massilia paldalensis TaxID=3377675 RepID=UPI00384ECFF0
MDMFSAGSAVLLSVPLQDKSGNALDVTAVSYRITDQNGVELVAVTTLDDFSPGSETADITVPAEDNQMAPGEARAMRNVELTCTIADVNTIVLHAPYVIQVADPLVVGTNSFSSFAKAEFTALSIPGLTAWAAASEDEKIAALIDARAHIVQLSFAPLNSNVNWGQDSLNYIPEGTYDTDYVGNSNMFLFNGNLDLLRPSQFAALPTRFVDALVKAQVAEADYILGGGDIEKKRQDGLVMDNIGESRQSFRQGKPLQLPVCRRALAYLSYFVTFAKRIGRC